MSHETLAEIIAWHEAEAAVRERQCRDAASCTARDERAAMNRHWWTLHHAKAAALHDRFAKTLRESLVPLPEGAKE